MTLLKKFSYAGATPSPSPWPNIQQPAGQTRMTVVTGAAVPGTSPFRPAAAMRVELHPYSASSPATGDPADGDVTDTGGYLANRSEVYDRAASPTSTAPAQWPDPVGSDRWYGWSVYVPSDFATSDDAGLWLNTSQWKGQYGGSPPIALEIYRGRWRLGGTKGNAKFASTTLPLVTKGAWTTFLLGMHFSPDPALGWLTLILNDVTAIPVTPMATMDYQADAVTADPTYLKQGIYRAPTWPDIHVLYYSPMRVGDSSDFTAPSPAVLANSGEFWGATV